MPLCGKPGPVAPLTVTRHQHLAGRQQAMGLVVMQKRVGLGAVLEAWLGKALVPKIHACNWLSWFIGISAQSALRIVMAPRICPTE